jgi:hypothetical protein
MCLNEEFSQHLSRATVEIYESSLLRQEVKIDI